MKSKNIILRGFFTVLVSSLVASCGIFGGGGGDNDLFEDRVSAIGVNGYLWRASLDTLSFMPMEDVDSAGGVIITDWYINPDVPTERLKVAVYILDQALRADGVKVSVFRQEKTSTVWTNATVRAATAQQIEDAILARARELRVKSLVDN